MTDIDRGKLSIESISEQKQETENSRLSFRNFQPGDEKKLLEIQAIALRNSSDFYNAEEIKALVESQEWSRQWIEETFIVAIDQGQIVGFAAGLPDIANVTGVYVHPDYARQGIGTQLLQKLEAKAIEYGNRRMDVFSSLTAENFYRANEYEVVKAGGFYASESIWIAGVRLKKNLPPPLKETEAPKPRSTKSTALDYLSFAGFAFFLVIGLPPLIKTVDRILEALMS